MRRGRAGAGRPRQGERRPAFAGRGASFRKRFACRIFAPADAGATARPRPALRAEHRAGRRSRRRGGGAGGRRWRPSEKVTATLPVAVIL